MGCLLTLGPCVCSFGPVGAGHVLEDGIQNLLLDLSNGVAVEDLHWDLGTVGVVGVDTAQGTWWSGERRCVGRAAWRAQGLPAAAQVLS